MWELEYKADFEKRAKRLRKTHRQELKNAADNLAAYLGALRQGLKPQQIERGFVHHEPKGCKGVKRKWSR